MKTLAQPVSAKKPRPYWHVDAKWVSGIVFGVALAMWLLLVVAYQVTQRETAVKLMANLVTFGMPVGDEASQQQALESLRKQIAESPTKSIETLPGVKITEADLALGPVALRDKIFTQFAEPIYDKGTRRVAEEQTSDKAAQDKFVNDATVFSLVTKESHDRIGVAVWIVGFVVLALSALAAYFSFRFGRIVTPALVLLLVSLPALLVFSAVVAITSQPAQANTEIQSYFELAMAGKGAFLPAAVAGQQVYLTSTLLALGLLAAAFIGKIVYSFTKKSVVK